MKKILYRLLYICLIVFTVTFTCKILITLYAKTISRHETHDKSYKITPKNSFTHNIGYYLLRPIIESRVDYYIQKNGLTEYLEHLKHKIVKPDLFKIHELTEGNGIKALCGQNVSVVIYKFSYSNSKNILTQASTNALQETKFKLGESIIKELNYAIEEMREGGERIVILKDEEGNLKEQYYIKLVSVDSTYPDVANDLLIFSNIIEDYEGDVYKIRCGDRVNARYSIRESNGKVILKDQELEFTIGENQAPLAVELGLINMRSDMTRSIIALPQLFY
ncbi:MAG: hypothetical protein ACTJLM_00675 [Ehrlichia sp.]